MQKMLRDAAIASLAYKLDSVSPKQGSAHWSEAGCEYIDIQHNVEMDATALVF